MKFGVVRIHADSGEARECEVASRFLTLKDPSDTSTLNEWINLGNMDWFSKDIKTALLSNRRRTKKLSENPSRGINQYLRNRRANIRAGDWHDLLLFYTVNDHPGVYMCGSPPVRKAGQFAGNQLLKFNIELKLTATACDTKQVTLHVAALPDDFRITLVEP